MVSGVLAVVIAMGGILDFAVPVVAEVNGEVITKRDVHLVFAPILKHLESRYEGEALEQRKQLYFRRVINSLIDQRLLVQVAKEHELEVDEDQVDAELDLLAERSGGWPRFLDMLSRAGISLDEKVLQVREGILVRTFLRKTIVSEVYTSPSELKSYYTQNPEEFREPSKYQVSQIILSKSGYTEEELKEKLEIIREKLAGGEDFAKVAKELSDGANREQGGDWGFLSEDDLVEELGSVLPKLKVGEVSEPIETSVGVHLLKVTDVKEATTRSMDDVRDDIETLLRKREYTIKRDRYVRDLRRKGYVRVYL